MQTVSCIILSHNAAAYIRAALDSALAQTHKLSQILVIDDSTDDSPRIVEEYAKHDASVQLLRVPPCNVSKARNTALDHATGDFISFLDADDVWLPTKSEKQLGALYESPHIVGAYAHYFDFRSDLDDMGRKVPRKGRDDPALRDVIFDQHMSSSTVLIRRSVIGSLRFDEKGPDAEDTIFMSELRLVGPWRLVDEPLIAKRIHGGQASTSHKHRIRNVNTRLKWLLAAAPRIDAGSGPGTAQKLHDELAGGLIGWLESRYWKRELADMKWMCDQARLMTPTHFGNSFLSRTKLYPRWFYRIRDLFGTGRAG
jgi:glycosyltransferase involved in cell wall biosynthesis